jgi:hypothetical protein
MRLVIATPLYWLTTFCPEMLDAERIAQRHRLTALAQTAAELGVELTANVTDSGAQAHIPHQRIRLDEQGMLSLMRDVLTQLFYVELTYVQDSIPGVITFEVSRAIPINNLTN